MKFLAHFDAWLLLLLCAAVFPAAAQVKTVTNDYHIDAVDLGIRLFMRQKMAAHTNPGPLLGLH